ncbi:hypothetical protein DWB58_31280, partial [candidate division KSB1 bacterium]|nr:hypothetical protein [candidate division KSB1 bacterium]
AQSERGRLVSFSRVQLKRARRHAMECIEIPRGSLLMGDNRLRDAAPQHKLELPAFAIGKYPVTNAEYAEFIAARGYANEKFWRFLLRTRLAEEDLKWR